MIGKVHYGVYVERNPSNRRKPENVLILERSLPAILHESSTELMVGTVVMYRTFGHTDATKRVMITEEFQKKYRFLTSKVVTKVVRTERAFLPSGEEVKKGRAHD